MIHNELFNDLNEDELKDSLKLFKKLSLNKNEYLHYEGDYLEYIYIVVTGKIEISKFDLNGNKNMIGIMETNDMFGESVALSKLKITPLNIMALSKVELLRISAQQIYESNITKLVINLLKITATKNTVLTQKIDCISKNTIKERVFEYLKINLYVKGSLSFMIPFNKNQLADYLCVNRSSLSREMNKMVEDGYFANKGKHFTLNNNYFNM